LFCPFDASAHVPPPIPNAGPPRAMPPPAFGGHFNPDPYKSGMPHVFAPPAMDPQPLQPRMLPPQHQWYGPPANTEGSYLSGGPRGHAPPIIEPLLVQQQVPIPQQVWYGTNVSMEIRGLTTEHQVLPAPNVPYYHQTAIPYVPEDPALKVPEPYPRYSTGQEMENNYQPYPIQRETEATIHHYNNAAGYYNSYGMTTAPYGGPSIVQQRTPPASGRPGLAEGSVPVSSYYSFAGATYNR